MIELMLDQAILELRLVQEPSARRERNLDPHFFAEASLGSGANVLARARMATARVRPESTGVVFPRSTLLEEHALLVVEDENRKRPVQRPRLMSAQLFFGAYFAVVAIDEYDALARQDAGAPSPSPAPAQVALRHAARHDRELARRLGMFAMRAAPPSVLLNPDTFARVQDYSATETAPASTSAAIASSSRPSSVSTSRVC